MGLVRLMRHDAMPRNRCSMRSFTGIYYIGVISLLTVVTFAPVELSHVPFYRSQIFLRESGGPWQGFDGGSATSSSMKRRA